MDKPRTLEMDHGQSLALAGGSVKVIFGSVWLTRATGAADYLLASDDAAVLMPRGSIIRSIGKTRVEVTDMGCLAVLGVWLQALRFWPRLRSCPRAGR